ncbi:MAG: RDD family protein [Ilumatobacteraceae bacterium]
MSNVPPPPPPPPPVPSSPPPPPAYGAGPAAGAVTGTYAGFGRRLLTSILDPILYGLAYLPFLVAGLVLIFAVGLGDCSTDPITDEIVCNGREDIGAILGGVALLGLGWVVLLVVYLRGLAKTGQTWGRRIAGVRVVRIDSGGVPGWGKAIGRTLFAGLVSGNFCYLGYLWMLWDDKNQTWHDKVTGTVVVRT